MDQAFRVKQQIQAHNIWLGGWLASKNVQFHSAFQNKETTAALINKLAQLYSEQQSLKLKLQCSSEGDEETLRLLLKNQDSILNELHIFKDPILQARIKYKIAKALRRRKWSKKRIKRLQSLRDSQQERANIHSQQQEEWRSGWLVDDEQRDKENKEELEVKKEHQQYLKSLKEYNERASTLQLLIQLRALRSAQLSSEQKSSTEFDKAEMSFQSSLASMKELLEQDHQEIQKMASNILPKMEAIKKLRKSTVDATDPVVVFYERGTQSIEGLIAVRKQWDAFLVPPNTIGGSKVPPTFVYPSPPANFVWASALAPEPL